MSFPDLTALFNCCCFCRYYLCYKPEATFGSLWSKTYGLLAGAVQCSVLSNIILFPTVLFPCWCRLSESPRGKTEVTLVAVYGTKSCTCKQVLPVLCPQIHLFVPSLLFPLLTQFSGNQRWWQLLCSIEFSLLVSLGACLLGSLENTLYRTFVLEVIHEFDTDLFLYV